MDTKLPFGESEPGLINPEFVAIAQERWHLVHEALGNVAASATSEEA
jgi:hypothetical protein